MVQIIATQEELKSICVPLYLLNQKLSVIGEEKNMCKVSFSKKILFNGNIKAVLEENYLIPYYYLEFL